MEEEQRIILQTMEEFGPDATYDFAPGFGNELFGVEDD